jgi:hypothetical protein
MVSRRTKGRGVKLTPIFGDPFALMPVEGDPFQQNMAVTDYAWTLPNVPVQPPIGMPGGAPLEDFAPAPVSTAAPQPTFPGLAGIAGDPSRSLAVRLPAAIGSSLADQGRGLVQSAWEAATLPGDVARGLVDPNSPEAIRRSTDLAGLLTLPAAGGEFNPDVMNAGPITAYHGSPHSFDQFDLSKIGTGEGAQAYGHGLYFAGNEDVAKAYRLAGATQPVGTNMANYGLVTKALQSAADQGIADGAARRTAALQSLQAKADAAPAKFKQPYYDAMNNFDALAQGGAGHMYQVAIDADPEHFLDWDKPLSEQHPVVQQNLATIPFEGIDDLIKHPGYSAKHLVPELGVRTNYSIRDANGTLVPSGASSVQEAISAAGGDPSRVVVVNNPDPTIAAQRLQQAGIPGIKYLDAGSRGAGNGSKNYVIFDDKTIAILKKYGLAGLGIGAGGAALMGQPQPAQASGFTLTPVDGDPFAQ